MIARLLALIHRALGRHVESTTGVAMPDETSVDGVRYSVHRPFGMASYPLPMTAELRDFIDTDSRAERGEE